MAAGTFSSLDLRRIFASLALTLAAGVLYSVVSYTVLQRTNEFGIRMALGGQRAHVMRIVFASTLVSVGSGIVARPEARSGREQNPRAVGPGNSRDPIILLAGVMLLSVVAAVACAMPARHAARVDPSDGLSAANKDHSTLSNHHTPRQTASAVSEGEAPPRPDSLRPPTFVAPTQTLGIPTPGALSCGTNKKKSRPKGGTRF